MDEKGTLIENMLTGDKTHILFAMSQVVRTTESGESGTIIGLSVSRTGQPQYLLRYKAGDGRQVENWFGEDAIEAA